MLRTWLRRIGPRHHSVEALPRKNALQTPTLALGATVLGVPQCLHLVSHWSKRTSYSRRGGRSQSPSCDGDLAQCDRLAFRQAVAGIMLLSALSCSRTGSRSPSVASRKTQRASSSGFTVLMPIDLSVSHASSNAVSNSTSA
jgi:hypothetical protein